MLNWWSHWVLVVRGCPTSKALSKWIPSICRILALVNTSTTYVRTMWFVRIISILSPWEHIVNRLRKTKEGGGSQFCAYFCLFCMSDNIWYNHSRYFNLLDVLRNEDIIDNRPTSSWCTFKSILLFVVTFEVDFFKIFF